MWLTSMAVFLNHWFTGYAEARRLLEQEGGYLLPFRHQFVVVTADAVRVLGMDPSDPDWSRIGYDWARPADAAAWARLRLQREIAA